MIEKREKDWEILEQRAVKTLESSYLLCKDVILKFYKPILRLWIYPSFEPYQVWYFSEPDFKTISLKNFKVIQGIWNRNEDFQRLNNPIEGLKKGFETEPKIEVSSIEIEKEVFEKIFDELRQIQFSAFANYRKSIGIDGVRCGIETFDFTHTTNISWWSVYPKEWQRLIDWFDATILLIRERFNDYR